MTTETLVRALIEALGFDVEVVNKEEIRKYEKWRQDSLDDNNIPVTPPIEPEYKLTKRALHAKDEVQLVSRELKGLIPK